MPGPLFELNTPMQCPHGAKATHVPSQVRVLIGSAPALTVADVGMVAGCPFQLPGPKPSPCVTIQWTAPAVRVKLSGQPALLSSSVGLCKSPEQAPQGPVIASPSPRVKGM
ncbi:MAG TPA: hypothetical protein VM869_05620 [Enhygromyxa sp.]|nr:hypothetical protein [Enhygromyxa sp.]